MHKVAFITQKGGSGKTTLSASLAVAAQAAHERVFLLDMDPQESLTTWAKNRHDRKLAVESVLPSQLPAVLAVLADSNVGLVIIDTPATLSIASKAAMKAADLVVIPARPTVLDIWATQATHSRARSLGKDYVFLLNQCPITQENRRLRDGIMALEATGALLRPLVSARVDYQESIRRGLGPTEYNPTGPAAEEMRQLWLSLRRRLTRLTPFGQSSRKAA